MKIPGAHLHMVSNECTNFQKNTCTQFLEHHVHRWGQTDGLTDRLVKSIYPTNENRTVPKGGKLDCKISYLVTLETRPVARSTWIPVRSCCIKVVFCLQKPPSCLSRLGAFDMEMIKVVPTRGHVTTLFLNCFFNTPSNSLIKV